MVSREAFSTLLRHHLHSRRTTSEPRDFILAIMPQTKFYKFSTHCRYYGSFRGFFKDCLPQLYFTEVGICAIPHAGTRINVDQLLDGGFSVPARYTGAEGVGRFHGPFGQAGNLFLPSVEEEDTEGFRTAIPQISEIYWMYRA